MCTVSMIGDYYRETTVPQTFPDTWRKITSPIVTIDDVKEDLSDIKKSLEELKKLLLAAKDYDEKMGEKDCEVDEKVAFIRKLAEFVDIDMEDVFGKA